MSDTTDDMEMWAGSMETEKEILEEKWEDGYHTMSDGSDINIKDMETSHLKNAIRYFKDFDTSPLERELKGRK